MTKTELEPLFRQNRSALVATLTRVFGPQNLDQVENVVQEAFVKAFETWSTSGVPDNPHGWLLTVARNRLRDQLRYQGTFQRKEPEVARWVEALSESAVESPRAAFDEEIADEELRMMFVACHPSLTLESQLALALRTLSGLETADIAKALLAEEATVEKRLVRARQTLRAEQVTFELPSADDLSARRDGVLRILYLLFSEGHSAHRGEVQVHADVCADAIRLATLLADHRATCAPEADALLALMLLHGSRLGARADVEGNLLTLAEQDRSRWDPRLIASGLARLARSAAGNTVSEYHLEAAIAACHATAKSFAETDWPAISDYYDQIFALNPSPVVGVHRAIAIGMARGAKAGLASLTSLGADARLDGYFLFHAARGELCARANQRAAAKSAWQRALELSGTEPERRFIEKKLAALEDG